MSTFALINEDNIVVDIIYFEKDPTDIETFVNIHANAINRTNLVPIKITDQHKYYSIGHYYDGHFFKPVQPYPSWNWDDNLYGWRAPVLHPTYWNIGTNITEHDGYRWDESSLDWIKIL